MSEWPKSEHVGTSWSIGSITGRRVGTSYHYLNEWPECKLRKGFRTRAKFEVWVAENGTNQQKLADAIDFRATLGLR